MNKVILIGNLTRDPETRSVPSGVTCCSFGLAVNRRFNNAQGQRETDFFNITAWRQLGDLCMRYLSKGRKVCVEGSIQIRTYDAQDGTKRTAVDIIADNVEFLSSANEPRQNDGFNAPPPPAPPALLCSTLWPSSAYPLCWPVWAGSPPATCWP